MNGKRGDKREGGRKVASYGPQFDFMAHAHSNVSQTLFFPSLSGSLISFKIPIILFY